MSSLETPSWLTESAYGNRMIVVDDSLLLAVLGGVAAGELAEAFFALELATTSSWYFRLGRAIRDPGSDGVHSRALARLSAVGRSKVHAALETPPAADR